MSIGFRRDASCWNNPDTATVKRIHRRRADDVVADCSTRIVLDIDSPIVAGSPWHRDALCRRCFPAPTPRPTGGETTDDESSDERGSGR